MFETYPCFHTLNTRTRVLDSYIIITRDLDTYIIIRAREITRYNKVIGLALNSSLEASSTYTPVEHPPFALDVRKKRSDSYLRYVKSSYRIFSRIRPRRTVDYYVANPYFCDYYVAI